MLITFITFQSMFILKNCIPDIYTPVKPQMFNIVVEILGLKRFIMDYLTTRIKDLDIFCIFV
jgi:hypothetical protein